MKPARVRVTLTAVVGRHLWGVCTETGKAVVWDQARLIFREPTGMESLTKELSMPRLSAKKLAKKAAKSAAVKAKKGKGR